MEHHYYFFTEILGALGFEHFAHEYQHVVYSWFIMLVLVLGALLLGRGIRLLPRKGQNVLEMVVGGLEDFMVEITGPEGRAFFPFIATAFLYIFFSNLIGLAPGFFSPTANINTTLSLALCPISTISNIIGAKAHTGPRKCLIYLTPCNLIPMMWVKAKVQRARERVVLIFAVGEKKPGARPIRLLKKM